MALIGDVERRAVRFLVAGAPRSGKTALANRLVHDLVRPEAAERSFGSGWSLAAAVQELLPRISEGEHHYFVHGEHAFVLDDRPADEERSGAVLASACFAHGALLVVDVTAGVTGETAAELQGAARLHLPYTIVAVNKMDRVGFEYEVFKMIRAQVLEHARLFTSGGIAVVPVSAWLGLNVVARGEALEWHPERTLLDCLVAVANHRAVRVAVAA
jgi:bifunctional enzyme CysN/CysC